MKQLLSWFKYIIITIIIIASIVGLMRILPQGEIKLTWNQSIIFIIIGILVIAGGLKFAFKKH